MPRPGLHRNSIVDTALDLVDEVGLDKLSTRALADRLGVASPALYWHFRNKDDLVTAMAEAMSLGLPGVDGAPDLGRRPGRAAVAGWLIERAQQFRQVLLSRRDGARMHAGSRPPTARLAAIELQLEALGRIGFDPITAARVTVAISRFVVGWVLEEQAETPGEDIDVDPTLYPTVAAALTARTQQDPDADFTASLTAIVHGLVSRS